MVIRQYKMPLANERKVFFPPAQIMIAVKSGLATSQWNKHGDNSNNSVDKCDNSVGKPPYSVDNLCQLGYLRPLELEVPIYDYHTATINQAWFDQYPLPTLQCNLLQIENKRNEYYCWKVFGNIG